MAAFNSAEEFEGATTAVAPSATKSIPPTPIVTVLREPVVIRPFVMVLLLSFGLSASWVAPRYS
jgi:hypothetical protein